MGPVRILAIDDEPNIRNLIRHEFALEGFEVATAKDGEAGLKALSEQEFDLVLLDIRLPKMDGMELLVRIKDRVPSMPVIMITAYGDIKTAVESVKRGACNYITKPFRSHELLALVRQEIEGRHIPFDREGPSGRASSWKANEQFILCPSKAMQQVYALVDKVSSTDKTIMIEGETGVGKDVLALQIHLSSNRRQAPFVCVDCGLLNQNLIESELYGHNRGAFSGADEKKIGLVEKSHGGTLFLDEIGNIDTNMQKKFLRFLETRRFRRLGETKEIHIDTRVILATNVDLREAVQKGLLRKDLFYRMDLINIRIPPLRKRPEDIEPLAMHMLKLERLPKGPRRISPEAMRILREYPWPGNVRELRSVITKAMIFAQSDVITLEDLPSEFYADRAACSRPKKTLEDMERDHIMIVLEETGGNQSKAAEVLGINRKTLYKKLHKYSIGS